MNRSFVLSLGLALGVWAVAPAAFSEEKTSPAPAAESAPKPETTTPAPEFTIKLDYSTVPECEAFALKAKELCEEWYPKLNELLFGPDQPLPRKEITLEFKQMDGVAYASRGRIVISAEWVTKKAPDDYGMVIHELTHIVQNYRGGGESWLTEGIADYVRDFIFEPGKRRLRVNPDRASYKDGYTTTAVFLDWLQKKTQPDLVKRLNQASRDRTYSPETFKQLTGKNVEEWWKEFTDELRAEREAKKAQN